jgi:hypothetical protein
LSTEDKIKVRIQVLIQLAVFDIALHAKFLEVFGLEPQYLDLLETSTRYSSIVQEVARTGSSSEDWPGALREVRDAWKYRLEGGQCLRNEAKAVRKFLATTANLPDAEQPDD